MLYSDLFLCRKKSIRLSALTGNLPGAYILLPRCWPASFATKTPSPDAPHPLNFYSENACLQPAHFKRKRSNNPLFFF